MLMEERSLRTGLQPDEAAVTRGAQSNCKRNEFCT
jgi:hypothetical protein